jgi:hypothetical protein
VIHQERSGKHSVKGWTSVEVASSGSAIYLRSQVPVLLHKCFSTGVQQNKQVLSASSTSWLHIPPACMVVRAADDFDVGLLRRTCVHKPQGVGWGWPGSEGGHQYRGGGQGGSENVHSHRASAGRSTRLRNWRGLELARSPARGVCGAGLTNCIWSHRLLRAAVKPACIRQNSKKDSSRSGLNQLTNYLVASPRACRAAVKYRHKASHKPQGGGGVGGWGVESGEGRL